MDAKQREELRTLAAGLLRVPAEKFRMDRWGEGTLRPDEPEFKCDYAGCAIGWLPKLVPGCGLRLEPCPDIGGRLRPHFDDCSDFGAVAAYFGISIEEADYLFDPSEYGDWPITPAEVSDRILAFLEDPDDRENRTKVYTVRVSELRRFSDTVKVEADSKEEAEEQALELFECDRSDSEFEGCSAEVVEVQTL